MKKDIILDTAAKVFSKKGYQGTKIGEIANQAQVAKGSVYLYFSSKEHLFIEMVKKNTRKFKDLKLSVLQENLPLLEKLKLLLKKEAEFLWENQEVARVLLTSDFVTQKELYNWLIETRQTFMEKLKTEFETAVEEVGEENPTILKLINKI